MSVSPTFLPYYLIVWKCIRNTDSQSCWKRIQFGSGSKTVKTLKNLNNCCYPLFYHLRSNLITRSVRADDVPAHEGHHDEDLRPHHLRTLCQGLLQGKFPYMLYPFRSLFKIKSIQYRYLYILCFYVTVMLLPLLIILQYLCDGSCQEEFFYSWHKFFLFS